MRVTGENPSVPPDVVETLLRHPDPSVRQGFAVSGVGPLLFCGGWAAVAARSSDGRPGPIG
ncbi:hypothetical protein C8054_26460 [Micromonospora sp. RP3T]|nr:hypothetical protein C8054_26460 [Micromonospora sp. RP3T]